MGCVVMVTQSDGWFGGSMNSTGFVRHSATVTIGS